MKILLLIGWRNLARRKWRTAATCSMLFIGALLIVFMTGMAEGAYGSMIEIGTRVYNGDFEVLAADYQDKPSLFKNIKGYEEIGERLRADPRVKGVAYRLESPGLVSHDNDTLGVLMVGMDPQTEICTYPQTLTEGAWWQALGDSYPTVIGKGVATRLGITVGSEISYVGQGADGSIAAELFTVVGISESGVEGLDRSIIYVPLEVAQQLLVLEGRVHRIVGLMKSRDRVGQLERQFQIEKPYGLYAWQTLLPNLAHTISADRNGGFFFLFIILAVILISVANTMMMSVMERTHELGVIQALGTSPLMMVVIVLAEIFFLALLGITPGVLCGVALNAWFGAHGMSFGFDDFSYGGVQLGVLYSANTWMGSFYFPLMVLAGAMLAGLLPAIKAAHLSVAKAMRD